MYKLQKGHHTFLILQWVDVQQIYSETIHYKAAWLGILWTQDVHISDSLPSVSVPGMLWSVQRCVIKKEYRRI